MMRRAPLASLACILLLGCATGRNYTDARGPRFAGTAASSLAADSLRIVTFNLHFGEDLDAAIDLLREHPRLRDADILVLQEMDEAGTERVARALGLHWVYYPATLHPRHDRNFGNAILARWPITEDHKVILPHLGRFRKTQRIAVAGTIVVAGDSVRVYSLHLGTAAELGPRRRRDQASAVVADAQATAGPVLIAGDLNSHGVGKVFAAAGFCGQ